LKKAIKIGDILLITLVIGAIGGSMYRMYFQDADSRDAVVSVSNKVVRVFSQSELMGLEIYTIPMGKGKAEIEVDGGKVRVLPMARDLCPRGICSATGWIKRNGSSIICMPNRLVIQLNVDTRQSRIDAVA
jgi:hypothetical protein